MDMHVNFSLINQMQIYDQTELILYIIASLFAAVLIGLSVSSYLKTGFINMKYAIGVFFLFCAFFIYENLELIFRTDYPLTDVILPATGLTFLIIYSVAVTKKK